MGNLIADKHPAWRSIIYVLLAMAGTACRLLSWLNEQDWYDKVVSEYGTLTVDDERQNDPILLRLGRSADIFYLGFFYGLGLSFGLIIYVEAPDLIAEAQRMAGEWLNVVQCLLPERSMLGRYCR